MTKREALFFLVGFQTATLLVFIAYKLHVGVFNKTNQAARSEEAIHG